MTRLLMIFTVVLLLSALITYARCECGIPVHTPSVGRIVGGTEAVPYSWPWQGAIENKQLFFFWLFECGGSLIAPNWFMTAAHCVYGQESNPENFRVKLGVFRHSSSSEPGEHVVGVKKIHRHPLYDSRTVMNDIALMELEVAVTYSDTISPVCLPQNDSYVLTSGNSVIETGWGTIYSGAPLVSGKLRQVTVPIVDLARCRQDYGDNPVWDSNFCAGEKGRDTCQGDSGGPGVQKTAAGRWVQYGITSWGNGCALQNYPGVYTRVGAFCDFIQSTTKLNLCNY